VPAITHVDFSARVQTVTPEANGRYYRLLRKFQAQTGCPILVNTSFNIRGEPIVSTPEDAYRCFMGTGLDALVLEDTLLLKEEQRGAKSFDASEYQRSFRLD
jgi:carbamoyltransferase